VRPPTYLVAIAAAGLVAAPVALTTSLARAANRADAQQSTNAQSTAVVENSAAAIQQTAEDHLNKAKAILASLPAEPENAKLVVTKDGDDQEKAAERIAKLKERFAELATAYRSASTDSSPDWKVKFSDVERELSRIIGGGAHSSATMATVAQVVSEPPEPAAGQTPGAGRSAASTAGGGIPSSAAPAASGARTIGAPAAPGAPTQGLVPTVPGVVGVGDPAPPGSIAAVPAPGTPAAAGGDAHPGTPADLTVIPARPAAAANAQERVVDIAAAKVSMIGIKELDPGIRKLLEQFRIELELFYTAPVNERRSS